MKKIVVTAALPYANGPIHIGHLVEYIQTDVFVRFLKLIGKEAIYICAEDAHGTAIEINAKKHNTTPEKFIAKWLKEHQEDFKNFHIKFDNYYTTNSKENKEYADFIYNKLKKKNHIYEKEVELNYCEKCKRFLPDRYIKGRCPKCGSEDQYGDVCEQCHATYSTIDLVNPYCVICKTKPIRRKSTHYFFKLSAFSDKLRKWLTENKNLQKEVVNHVIKWIDQGLEDWDITRDAPYFGFKIPGEKDKYYYVWLDAPIGYIASTKDYCKKKKLKVDDYWKKGRIIHFIGKDIIYFHFLFWPAMLLDAGFSLPERLAVHGFLTVNKEKMSKSRGTFFTAKEFLKKYNPEFLRYYYCSNLTNKMEDLDLSFDDFTDKINNELIANIGNFIYRVLHFCKKNFNGKITKEISDLKVNCDDVINNYNELNFRAAVREILDISSKGNKYFQDNEPWKLIKDDKKDTQKIVNTCFNLIKDLTILLKPILPKFTEEIEKQINLKLTIKDLNKQVKNHKIKDPKIVFQKIEKEKQPQLEKKKEKKEINFLVSSDVKKLGINVAAAIINNVKLKKRNTDLEKLKKESIQDIAKIDVDNEIIKENEKIYKKINVKADSAAKQLILLVKEKKRLPTINTLVDSYNLIEAKRLVSAGAHDINKIKGDVRFIITKGDEIYVPLGQAQREKINPGEFAAVDDEHVICRLDVKQGNHTKIDLNSKNVFLYVQGNKKTSEEYLKETLKEMCETIVKFCGGEYEILGKDKFAKLSKDPFSKLNIKVAKVLSVKDVPKADKLYEMEIDLGTEKRIIVAGLNDYYSKEELMNKNICILTNLEKRKFRGIESKGMLLAAETKGKCKLLLAPNSNAGDKVYIEGIIPLDKEIDYKTFSKIKMKTKDKKIIYNNKYLKTDNEEVICNIKEGVIVS